MTQEFEYYQPGSLKEAIQLKHKFGSKAGIIAGGTDLMVNLRKLKKSSFEHLISLKKISTLDYIREESGYLYIGAMTTHTEIAKSHLITSKYAVLSDAASQIGSVQVRNVATIGGNICSSLPSADSASPLLVLGAKVKIASESRGEYIVDLTKFFTGPGKNILQQDELLAEFIIPAVTPNTAGAYYKVGRRKAMEIALLAAAVYLKLDKDKNTCLEAVIALTTLAPTPLRLSSAVKELIGKPINEETLGKAGAIAVTEASPRTSFRCNAEYRKDVIPIAIKRAGLRALERASAGWRNG